MADKIGEMHEKVEKLFPTNFDKNQMILTMDCCYDPTLERFEEESALGWWVEPKSKVTHWMHLPRPPRNNE